jgi:hypothetical protein
MLANLEELIRFRTRIELKKFNLSGETRKRLIAIFEAEIKRREDNDEVD